MLIGLLGLHRLRIGHFALEVLLQLVETVSKVQLGLRGWCWSGLRVGAYLVRGW
jgi:hypothetical protein